LVHELNEDDPDRRNDNFSRLIVFSDEATFKLNGNINRQNMRYWCGENPNWMIDSRATQNLEKVNVWAGMINNTIVGPFFIEGKLTAQKYETMLRDDIIPAI